MNNLVFTLKME